VTADRWYICQTKKGELLVHQYGNGCTAYDRSRMGVDVTSEVGSRDDLLRLVSRGTPAPNGAKLLDEARRAAIQPALSG
jgi:hypothetical protein